MWQDIRKTSSVQVIVGTKIRDFIKPCLLVVMYYGLNNKLYSCQENSNTTSFSWRTKSTFSLSVLCTYQGTEWILRAQNMPKVSLRTPWIKGVSQWDYRCVMSALTSSGGDGSSKHHTPGRAQSWWGPRAVWGFLSPSSLGLCVWRHRRQEGLPSVVWRWLRTWPVQNGGKPHDACPQGAPQSRGSHRQGQGQGCLCTSCCGRACEEVSMLCQWAACSACLLCSPAGVGCRPDGSYCTEPREEPLSVCSPSTTG